MYLVVLALTGRRLVTNPRGTLGWLRRKHWGTVSLLFYVGAIFLLCYSRVGVGTMFLESVMLTEFWTASSWGQRIGESIKREGEITLCWSYCLINIGRLCWISVKRRPNRVEKLRSRETMVVNTISVGSDKLSIGIIAYRSLSAYRSISDRYR